MCFLKFIPETLSPASHCQDPLTFAPSCSPFPASSPLSSLQLSTKQNYSQNNAHLAMLSCIKMLVLNTQAISALDEKLKHSDALLTKTKEIVTFSSNVQEHSFSSSEHLIEGESTAEEGHTSSDPLTAQLFGNKTYKYRLVLVNPLQDTLYKDRNFGMSFKLLNISTGQLESNGNLINICLGVCDAAGEWVQETKEGGPLLKGKLEAELYHGQAEFNKLSPRDVSRGFNGKKVTFVVYAKPSLLQYSGESSLERKIEHNLIEPLLVKDITIKAKRRD